MGKRTYPQTVEKFEIQSYKQPSNIQELVKHYVAFTGSPRRHPYDDQKVLLVPDPYSAQASCYEFKTQDISYAEELPNLVNARGETVPMARIWVKKQSVAARWTPFVVSETLDLER